MVEDGDAGKRINGLRVAVGCRIFAISKTSVSEVELSTLSA